MLPEVASAWVIEHRGAVLETTPLESTQGQVWWVDSADGEAVVVKSGPTAAIEREVWGLGAAADTGQVPRVLARLGGEVLVLSRHAGKPCDSPGAMRAAGQWLRAFHRGRCDGSDSLDLAEALRRRRDAWLRRASSELDVSNVADLDFSVFSGLERVPCHRDFTPSNWLWSEAGVLTVVDFGQARPDARLWDLAKLEGETFREDPDLRGPFYEGYGRLDADDAHRLGALVLLHGLQTAVWGDTHADAGFSGLGRAILRAGRPM